MKKKLTKHLAKLLAIIMMVQSLFSAGFMVPVQAAGELSTFQYVPNGHKYLAWEMKQETISMNVDGQTLSRKVNAEAANVAAKQKELYEMSFLFYRVLNGTGNIDLWNAYAAPELKAAKDGNISIADENHIPNVWYLNSAEGQSWMKNGGIIGLSRDQWIALLRDHRYVSDSDISANLIGNYITKQMLHQYLMGRRVAPRFMRVGGNVLYCLQVLLAPPESGDSSLMEDDALNLRYSEERANQVKNAMYYGHPVNTNLEDRFKSLPAAAMEEATQLVIWKVLDGTTGNTQSTDAQWIAHFNGGGTHAQISAKNPIVTQNDATHQLALEYYNYLLSKATSEKWVNPQIDKKITISDWSLNGSNYEATITFKTTKVSNLIIRTKEDLPSGSTINGTAVNRELDLGDLGDGDHSVKVTIPVNAFEYGKEYKYDVIGKTTYGNWLYKTPDNVQDYGAAGSIPKEVGREELPPVKLDPLNITVNKFEKDKTIPLAGAEFTVYTDAACTIVAKDVLGKDVILVTNTDGKAVSAQMLPAVYYVKETKAPAGYFLDPNAAVMTVDLSASLSKGIVASNEPTKIVLSKTDMVTGEDIPDAELIIKNEAGEEVYRWTTDGNPHYIEKLPAGNYTLTEVRTPFGYQIAEVQSFTVDNTNKVQAKKPMKDNETYGMLQITKNDAASGAPLAGVEFELRYKNDVKDWQGHVIHKAGDVVEKLVTNEKGQASLSKNVPIGTYGPNGWNAYIEYELVETKRLSGQYEAIDPIPLQFTYVNDKTPVVVIALDLSNKKPDVKFAKHGSPETFEGDYTESTRDEITVVQSGDTITYTIEVWNEGMATAHNILIKDTVPEHTTFARIGDEHDGLYLEDNNTCYWFIEELAPGARTSVSFDVTVDELENLEADIVNVGFVHIPGFTPDDPRTPPTDQPPYEEVPPEKWIPTTEVVHRTKVQPDYEITKVRVDEAPEVADLGGKFGFYRDDIVTYEVTIENTGDVDLTHLKVEDEYEEIAKDFFDEIKYLSVSGEGVEWLNESESKETDIAPELSIKVGSKATMMISAHITKDAVQYLADTPEDNRDDLADGYVNTVKVSEVVGEYDIELPDPDSKELGEKSKKVEHRVVDQNDFDELCDKMDAANTPVQLKVGYFMSKIRDSKAEPAKTTPDMFGFKRGDVVQYRVYISNYGDVALNLDLTDEYEEIAKDFFTDIQYIEMQGEGAVWENEDPEDRNIAPNITIEAGRTIHFIITAKITDEALQFLAPDEMDQLTLPYDGYINIATTKNAKAEYPEYVKGVDLVELTTRTDDNTRKGLIDQSGTANTPVQIHSEYEITKSRVSKAPEKETEKGKYGFKVNDKVEYTITVENKGLTTLTMDVADSYEKKAEKFFKDITYVSVEGENVKWNNEKESKGTSTPVNITLEPGAKAVIKVTAVVADKAIEYLVPWEEDKKDNPDDGYVNTAIAYNVIATFDEYVPGEEIPELKEGKSTKAEDPALEDKTDTANTPIQGFVASKEKVLGLEREMGMMLGFGGLALLLLAAAGASALIRKRRDA